MEPVNKTNSLAPLVPLAAALGLTVVAVLHVTGDHTFEGHYDAAVEYFNDAAFVLALCGIGLSALLIELRQGGRGRVPARSVAIGDLLLIVGVIAGMVSGEDPSWFLVLAVPGQLLNLFGLVALAARSWTVGTFAPWSLALIALTMPLGIIGAEAGLSVVPALGWLGIAWSVSRQGFTPAETRTA